MIYSCETCLERVIPAEGVTTLEQHGYLWHIACCDFQTMVPPVVAFPSRGKLIPKTIFHEGDD
jgi:hypothetical protein